MRLWSLHPMFLDARGLVALWREGLLAQAVLGGKTTGYRSHPQLARFRRAPSPAGTLAHYLRVVHAESLRRGYRFQRGRIRRALTSAALTVTDGQLRHEWRHLLAKLAVRAPEQAARLRRLRPLPNPVFRVVPGPVEEWERRATIVRHRV
jgi:hypothetical protein